MVVRLLLYLLLLLPYFSIMAPSLLSAYAGLYVHRAHPKDCPHIHGHTQNWLNTSTDKHTHTHTLLTLVMDVIFSFHNWAVEKK